MNASAGVANAASGMAGLVDVVQRLSLARDLPTVQEIVRRAARSLTGADGATFVLRDGDLCHYADEDAIAPLWKGRRFPMEVCISGWCMLNRQATIIEDIYADPRIPHEAYRPTFVKSLVMTPIRTMDPLGAIGAYWATPHRATPAEVQLLQALADTTAVAVEHVRVITELEERVRARTAELELRNQELSATNNELLAAQQQADRVFAAYAKGLAGAVLDGKYRLDKQLGAGGFGVVFAGRHLTLDRAIAIKVFRPAPGNDSALDLQRFLREGIAAARLNHPNAVRVMDSGISGDGVPFLAMELLEGRSLAQELAAQGPMSLRRCAWIASNVADVIAAAHRLGILHRDIKPQNIFLHRNEDREVVKVVDFGLAKFFESRPGDTPRSQLTRSGEFLGTPSFIAPERVTGISDDIRSDVFSLGAVLYETICGASPWSGQRPLERLLGDVQRWQPKPIRLIRRGVPEELVDLVSRALAWDRRERPSAEEFAAELAGMTPRLDDTPPDLVEPRGNDAVQCAGRENEPTRMAVSL